MLFWQIKTLKCTFSVFKLIDRRWDVEAQAKSLPLKLLIMNIIQEEFCMQLTKCMLAVECHQLRKIWKEQNVFLSWGTTIFFLHSMFIFNRIRPLLSVYCHLKTTYCSESLSCCVGRKVYVGTSKYQLSHLPWNIGLVDDYYKSVSIRA